MHLAFYCEGKGNLGAELHLQNWEKQTICLVWWMDKYMFIFAMLWLMFILVTRTFIFVICMKMEIGTSTNSTLIFHLFTNIVFVASPLIMTLMIDSFGVVSLMIYTWLVTHIGGWIGIKLNIWQPLSVGVRFGGYQFLKSWGTFIGWWCMIVFIIVPLDV